jgi:hypothetical protein
MRWSVASICKPARPYRHCFRFEEPCGGQWHRFVKRPGLIATSPEAKTRHPGQWLRFVKRPGLIATASDSKSHAVVRASICISPRSPRLYREKLASNCSEALKHPFAATFGSQEDRLRTVPTPALNCIRVNPMNPCQKWLRFVKRPGLIATASDSKSHAVVRASICIPASYRLKWGVRHESDKLGEVPGQIHPPERYLVRRKTRSAGGLDQSRRRTVSLVLDKIDLCSCNRGHAGSFAREPVNRRGDRRRSRMPHVLASRQPRVPGWSNPGNAERRRVKAQ